MNRNRIAGVSACVVSLAIPLSAVAATWQPTAASHDGNQLHVLYAFEDGVATQVSYTPTSDPWVWSADANWVLANSSDPSHTGMLFSFAKGAPNVNWANKTIDVGGMYMHGVNPLENTGTGKFGGWVFQEMIGWSVAPSAWVNDWWGTGNPNVPFVDNGDGTYTASWSYANSVMGGFGGYYPVGQMTITFASTVPAPAPIWLFMTGLGGLSTFFRLRKGRSLRPKLHSLPYHTPVS